MIRYLESSLNCVQNILFRLVVEFYHSSSNIVIMVFPVSSQKNCLCGDNRGKHVSAVEMSLLGWAWREGLEEIKVTFHWQNYCFCRTFGIKQQ